MIGLSDRLLIPDGIEYPRFYSPLAETSATTGGNLPHWEQPGKTVFVTFRLADSIPREKLLRWQENEIEEKEKWLDTGYGECVLRDFDNQDAVRRTLRYGDGKIYRLYGFVIMPNHVHVVFMPLGENKVCDIVKAWKSVSSRSFGKNLGRSGHVWQDEYFDRYIRNDDHFEYVMRYVRKNDPQNAWLVCQ